MVEWKKLGDVCKVLRGKRLTKSQLSETDGYPVLHGGSTPMGFYSEYNRKANTTVVVNTGNAGSVFFYNKEFWSSDACFSLYPNNEIIDKFLYLYVYGCENILKGKIRAGAMPTIDSNAVESLIIPIPSLSEQTRIVGILDTFTSAIDNLKEQIAQRRKQYEYYRDQLLDLEGKEGVEMKTLGGLCELVTKQTGFDYSGKIKPALLTNPQEGALPFLQTKNFSGRKFDYNTDYYVPERIVEQYPKIVLNKQCLLFSIVGASIGNIGLFPGSRRCFLGGAICVLKFLDGINIHYVYEVMSSWYGQKQIREKTKGAGQATITVEDVRKFVIPYPNSEIQTRIVSILDTFEASVANLEQQLALREKQYEYYRNKLLTFE